MKIGIKSEIHDCIIAIARLLAEKQVFSKDLVYDISQSKEIRIDTQYYVEGELSQTMLRKNVENARRFVLEIEKAIENITLNKSKILERQLKT